MGLLAAVTAQHRRFFDGGPIDADPPHPDPNADLQVDLTRLLEPDGAGREREVFRLRRRIGYCVRAWDDAEEPEDRYVLVPADGERWRTDLTSVPALFTWLVPKSGRHLPAALIHDGLVRGRGQPLEHLGPDVTRVEADTIFRDAMADLGTGVVRRWLVWTAVAAATMIAGDGTAESTIGRRYYRWIVVLSIAVIAWLGLQATLDLADVAQGRWFVGDLPWMRADSFAADLGQGVAGAIAVPVVGSVLWWRFWRAGAIAGVAVALFLHVSLMLLALTGLYLAAERVALVANGRLLAAIGAVAVGASFGVLLALVVAG
jgi:hypothetical protein